MAIDLIQSGSISHNASYLALLQTLDPRLPSAARSFPDRMASGDPGCLPQASCLFSDPATQLVSSFSVAECLPRAYPTKISVKKKKSQTIEMRERCRV
jgi:hypothetical protein